MVVTLQHLVEIDDLLVGKRDAESFASAANTVKQRIADLVIMRCDASDVLEEPYRSYDTFDLHLIDGTSHCPVVTANPDKASGLLLAWRGKA